MGICIVPNYLSEFIYAEIDARLERCPELTLHREDVYRDLLTYYDEHGCIPDFELKVTEAAGGK